MTVLCYHGVEAEWQSSMAVDPADFERQCRWLAGTGRVTAAGSEARAGQHVLTFDDGFASVYHCALPALRRHRLPATVFVVAATLLSEPMGVDWVGVPESYSPLTMTSEQILEALDAGVAVGSHSWAHRELPQLSESECVADLKDSRELLEDLIRGPVPLLAYPYGLHAAHVRRAAQRAGYTHAYALPEGRESAGPYALPRVGVYRGNALATVRLKSTPIYSVARFSRAYSRLRPTTSS